MDLPFVKFFKTKEKPKFYLAFILRHEKAIAVIFEQLGTSAKVVGKGEAHFTKDIENADFEELLSVCDKAISKAEENVPEDAESLQVLFGLKDSWIEEDKIKKAYLEKLKKISDELGLAPIGFITITEAISNLIKKEEGAPVTAILSEIGKNYVTVSLIKAGKILETKSSEIHENPPFTVDVLLKHLEVPDVLPSKIIIYNGGDEDLSQRFISHQWSKSLPFLHLPQIIGLPDGFDAKSILQGAATKMGFSIISEDSDKILEKKEEIPSFETIDMEKNEDKPLEEMLEKKEEVNFIESEDFVEKFGFFENEDVLKFPPTKSATEETLAASLGEEAEKQEKTFEDKALEEEKIEEEEVGQETKYEDLDEPKIRKKPNNFLMFLGNFKLALASFFKNIKIPKNKIIAIPSAIVLILVILFTISFFIFKTDVVLTLSPKIEEQKQTVIFSKNNTNVDQKIIKGEFVETSFEGTASTGTTGKKETGTEAKGTVAFYSRFTEKTTIPAGTILTSSNNIDFTLDKAVELASASADASASPSTANGNVTASKIGKEGNLPSGTKFNVDDFTPSSIIAKNESAFSGGTKKEITVVSKTDTDKLLTQIIKDSEKKAIEELTKKINTSEQKLLPVIVDSNFEKKDFDKEVEDEATKLNLKATINFQGLSYSNKDLISFTESLLKKDLSSKMEIDKNNITVDVADVKKRDTGEVSASLKIKAPLLPSINKKDIAQSLTSKSKEDARTMLLKISQVEDVDINPSLPIPFLTNFLPRFSNNINIITRTNE